MSIVAITAALKAKGFAVARPRCNGIACYAGTIPCHGENVPVEIEVVDADFVALPKVRVLRRPSKLTGFQPHFGIDDELCYADKNEASLDRYRPGEAVVGCLERASRLLEDLSSKKPPADDTHEEFGAYWHGAHLFTDVPAMYVGPAAINIMDLPAGSRQVLVATKNSLETAQRLTRAGWKAVTDHTANCFFISVKNVPCVDRASWPLRTLGDALTWLKNLDDAAHRVLHRQLASEWIVRTALAGFVLRTPAGDYGFSLDIDAFHAKGYRRKPSRFRDYLLQKANSSAVTLLSGQRIDAEYLHGRNLIGASLRNKIILLAGCGTVGGYLANFLARLGAGTGDKGRLIVADPDVLLPGNLGRHILGLDRVLQNKSLAMVETLTKQFPHLSIDARPVDVRETREFLRADLLIDVTGEEPLSTAINAKLAEGRRAGKKMPAALYCWIAGPGVAVQALLSDSTEVACYRCMRVLQPNGELDVRFNPVREAASALRRVGCESFMPFAVTAASRAASLAGELVLSWAKGDPSPRLRTDVLDDSLGKHVKDQDPSPLASCPACRKS